MDERSFHKLDGRLNFIEDKVLSCCPNAPGEHDDDLHE